jgi:hypothetical protein
MFRTRMILREMECCRVNWSGWGGGLARKTGGKLVTLDKRLSKAAG